MTGDLPTDNRKMTLTVAGANIANIKVGDTFTIGTTTLIVNAVNQVDKSDTGVPQTFRILAVAGGGATLTISPPIISVGPYQNCNQAATTAATINFLNTATAPCNPFWSDGAVVVSFGRLFFAEGAGLEVGYANTKQGVPLAMAASQNLLTTKKTIRFSTKYAVTVRDPEKCGLIVANQV
jgi:hypothetical protein